MDTYSYKKDKEKGQTVLRNHYLRIRKYSKILKAFPLIKSKIQTVQYESVHCDTDKIDDIFHEKLQALVNSSYKKLIDKIGSNHFTTNDKLSPDTPRETAFIVDNFIEFAKVFKDNEKKASPIPSKLVNSEQELDQSVNMKVDQK